MRLRIIISTGTGDYVRPQVHSNFQDAERDAAQYISGRPPGTRAIIAREVEISAPTQVHWVLSDVDSLRVDEEK